VTMTAARPSTRRRTVPLFLILLVVSAGFLLLFWQHVHYVEFEHQLDRRIANETGRMAIGSLLVSDLEKVKAHFYQMITPMEDRQMRMIHNQAMLGLAEIRDALNVLEHGGVIMRKLALNTVMGQTVTFPIVYFPDEKPEYNLPVLTLRPQVDQLEEMIRRVPRVVRQRNQILAQERLDGIKPRVRRLKRFIKKAEPLFIRMEENANTLAHESRLNLRTIQRRSDRERNRHLKVMGRLALVLLGLVLTLVALIVHQILTGQRILAEEVDHRTRELKEQGRALARERDRWQRTFDAIPDIITIQDPDFTILQTNRAGREFFSQNGSIIGRHCYTLFHGINTPCTNCPVSRVHQKGESHLEEVEHPLLDKWFQVSSSPIFTDGRLRYVVHVARDITEQKAMERNFLQAQKMESVGRLAGGVAHDFNNILSAINGYAELALLGLEDDNPVRADVELILKAGQRASRLVQQLLAFSRKQVIERTPLDLNREIEEHRKMLSRLLGEDIEVRFLPAPDLGPVLADRSQVGQILLNLAVNSRDAMPAGGRLTIETANIDVDEDFSRLHNDLPPGPYVTLSVSDTGRGIAKTIIDHIFEPFFTTKEQGRGTGLGLATIHGIVKQHHGEITVYSEPGRGTTFRIYLPRARQQDGTPRQDRDRQEAFPPLPRLTVLLVEDEELVRAMIARPLREAGCTVFEAADGREGLRLFAEHGAAIDLLITDVIMPRMNGPDLARRLRQQEPELAIIFMSGYSEQGVLEPDLNDGNSRFIQKPVTPVRIREIIGQLRFQVNGKQEDTINVKKGGQQ